MAMNRSSSLPLQRPPQEHFSYGADGHNQYHNNGCNQNQGYGPSLPQTANTRPSHYQQHQVYSNGQSFHSATPQAVNPQQLSYHNQSHIHDQNPTNVNINQQEQNNSFIPSNQIYGPNQNYQYFSQDQHRPALSQTTPSQTVYGSQPQVCLPPPPISCQPSNMCSGPVPFFPVYSAINHDFSTSNQPRPSLRMPPPFCPPVATNQSPAYNFSRQSNETLFGDTYRYSTAHSGPYRQNTMPSRKIMQREVDQDWINSWSKSKDKKTIMQDSQVLSITEARNLLVEAAMLWKELGHLKEGLNEMTHVSESEWRMKMQYVFTLKHNLQVLQKKLMDSSVVNALKKKLKKRQQKRRRLKEKRQEQREEQERRNANRESLHRIIDTFRNSIQEKVLEKKRNKEMQAEADNILAEVKRKIHDIKRAQECTKVLEKLRQIRKENSQKKGLHVSRQSDESFQKHISEVKELLQKQMCIYEAEEKALRVMLESEREEQRELENSERQQRMQEHLSRKETVFMETLFGTNDLDPSHPLYFYWKYYTQAECSLESLLQIRYQWDAFLVEDGDESLCLPIQWVVPSKPSSELWTAVLK